MDVQEPEAPALWFVCFRDSDQPVFPQNFLQPGFQHVFLIGLDLKHDCWFLINPLYVGIDARVISGVEAMQTMKECTVLEHMMPKRPTVRRTRLLLTCSSFVCHILGLTMFVHTPYRIYVALLKAGAIPRTDLSEA